VVNDLGDLESRDTVDGVGGGNVTVGCTPEERVNLKGSSLRSELRGLLSFAAGISTGDGALGPVKSSTFASLDEFSRETLLLLGLSRLECSVQTTDGRCARDSLFDDPVTM
jgi:hypothetical protein